VLGILSSGASGILLQEQSVNAQATKIYDNPLYGLRVPYPLDWVVDDTEEGEVVFAPQIGENIPSISIIVLPDSTSDLAAMAESLKQLQVSRGATIVDEEQSTINGRDAYSFSWSGQDPFGGTYKNAAVITQTSDFLYTFSIGSNPIEDFRDMAAILNMMVLGAELTESGSSSQIPSNNLGGDRGILTNNDTSQEGQELQGGGRGFGENGDRFDPFTQESPNRQSKENQGEGFGESGQDQPTQSYQLQGDWTAEWKSNSGTLKDEVYIRQIGNEIFAEYARSPSYTDCEGKPIPISSLYFEGIVSDSKVKGTSWACQGNVQTDIPLELEIQESGNKLVGNVFIFTKRSP
jgi:hypothetical protein